MYHLKISKTPLLLLFTLFIFFSCSDDFDPATGLEGSISDIFTMLRSEDIAQRATLPSDDFNFVSTTNTIITAEPNSFVYRTSGLPYTGPIDFEYTELFTKSDMLRYGIQTLSSEGHILESDGEFLFEASADGDRLELGMGKQLIMQVVNANPNDEMQLFEGGEISWRPIDAAFGVGEWAGNSQNSTFSIGYVAEIPNLNWVNIDYFTKFDEPLTTVSVCLPDGYNSSNTVVYAIFENLDIFLFVSLSSGMLELPVGHEVSFVAMAAEDSDTFRYQKSKETIRVDHKVNLNPERTSALDIKASLEELND